MEELDESTFAGMSTLFYMVGDNILIERISLPKEKFNGLVNMIADERTERIEALKALKESFEVSSAIYSCLWNALTIIAQTDFVSKDEYIKLDEKLQREKEERIEMLKVTGHLHTVCSITYLLRVQMI